LAIVQGAQRSTTQAGVRPGVAVRAPVAIQKAASMTGSRRPKWEYLVGHFSRRGAELWFESSHHGRMSVRGGVKGYAEVLNTLGGDGWELVHCDDTPPRTVLEAGEASVYAWGDMIFKRTA
jgi:hypothetical protein